MKKGSGGGGEFRGGNRDVLIPETQWISICPKEGVAQVFLISDPRHSGK